MTNLWAQRLAKSKPAAPLSSDSALKTSVRVAVAEQDALDSAIIDIKQTPETISSDDERAKSAHKLSQLIDEDFPFDESQLAAIEGMVRENYACLTGAAGTGKTTTTKKLVDELQNQLEVDYINMSEYFKTKVVDDGDEYEAPEQFIPAIAMVGFTGRSSQMIKRNFPRDWHGNIMTIHRLLAFAPVWFEVLDEESGDYKKKMRFEPGYTADCRLPWDIIIIDEAGMVGLDLWHQLWAAMKPGCRIYMIGDINQLPPVHGRSVFGFALAKWPAFELTHIHRQVGKDNPIVDNAWRILKGLLPTSGGRFQMVELKGDAQHASRLVRAMMPKLQERGVYDPLRDSIITPINGNEGSRGFALGQLPLNREFSLIFNPQSTHPRYIIDGGREKKQFAVGDKVMATKNDHEAGITNGMTGIITDIVAHQGYGGEHRRFGLIADVNAFFAETGEEENDDTDFSLESLKEDYLAVEKGKEDKKEKADRGPSSHIVTVRFGEGEHGFELPFSTLGEVGSLMTAYVVTCHKMQGGESPTVVIICHDAHKQMLYREWLYTAVTRASEKCILLFTQTALRTALSKQNIKGATLKEKIASFNALQSNNGLGIALKVILPDAQAFGEEDENASTRELATVGATDVAVYQEPATPMVNSEDESSSVAEIPAKVAPPPPPVSESPKEKIRFVFLNGVTIKVTVNEAAPTPESKVEPESVEIREVKPEPEPVPPKIQLMAKTQARKLLMGPEPMKLLTHVVTPVVEAQPRNAWAAKLKRGN